MMDIWNDPPEPQTPTANNEIPAANYETSTASTIASGSPSESSEFSDFSEAPLPPRKTLTQHQSRLVYHYSEHVARISETQNKIVDLQIRIGRERDQPGVKGLQKDLAKAQVDLQRHKDEKSRKLRLINQEEERLKKVVGEDAALAKRQLNDIDFWLGRQKTRRCLR